MTAITRIKVKGFRSLQDVDLEPGRITVLIGANGSGKSNLLSALRMMSLMRTQSLRRFVGESGGASALLHYGPTTTQEVGLRLEFKQESGSTAYEARLGYAARDSLLFLDEAVGRRPSEDAEFDFLSLGTGHSESLLEEEAHKPQASRAKMVQGWMSRLNFFHFHDTSRTSPLRQNSRQADVDYLRSDGSNLAAYLRRLATSESPDDAAAWKRINLFVRQIAGYVKRLEPDLVDSAHPETSAVRLYWTDERDHHFDVHDFSDGTLRAIALMTALAQPVSHLPAFVSIDEPELGMHPAAITLLAGLIRSVAPVCQVLLATQSPALLDQFVADDIVVAERENGSTSFRRLNAKRLQSWLEDYSLSELFDKNVLGGRP